MRYLYVLLLLLVVVVDRVDGRELEVLVHVGLRHELHRRTFRVQHLRLEVDVELLWACRMRLHKYIYL